MRHVGAAGLTFSVKDRFKQVFAPPREARRRERLAAAFLSGGAAGAATTSVFYPLEFLRTRLALDVGGKNTIERLYPRGMRDVLERTLAREGVTGLYKGFGVALGGVVLFRALHLGGYDYAKDEMGKRGEQTIWKRFFIAQLVSVASGTVCYPIDTVRRRLMMTAGKKKDKVLYANARECVAYIYSTEGVSGFFRGLAPNVVRSGLGGAFLLVSYDEFKAFFAKPT